MPNVQRLGLWEIAVLALLRERPMHPYEMLVILRDRHKDEILVLKRGSLYHAINRLAAAQLIHSVTTAREGHRPERTTYRITPTGRRKFTSRLREMIAIPVSEGSEFMGAVSFLLHLTTPDATSRLRERARRLEQEVTAMTAGIKPVYKHVARIHLLEAEYLLAMKKAELRWVRELLQDVESRKLEWNEKSVFQELRGTRKK